MELGDSPSSLMRYDQTILLSKRESCPSIVKLGCNVGTYKPLSASFASKTVSFGPMARWNHAHSLVPYDWPEDALRGLNRPTDHPAPTAARRVPTQKSVRSSKQSVIARRLCCIYA